MPTENPVFILTDDAVSQGAALVKSVFEDASDDECMMVATGAFMLMLTEHEGGDVVFAYSENGPFFKAPTRAERAKI